MEVINHDRAQETWFLNVDDSFVGKFQLEFLKNGESVVTKDIESGISAAELKTLLWNEYFRPQSSIKVERTQVTDNDGKTHSSYKI